MTNPIFLSPTNSGLLKPHNNLLIGSNDQESYPVFESIPVLIQNPHEHLNNIKKIIESHRGEWYGKEQRSSYTSKSYRTHINKRRAYVQKILSTFLKSRKNESINYLELGCGDGEFSDWLKNITPSETQLYFTDYNLDRLLRAKEKLNFSENIHIFASDIAKPVLPDQSMDFIFSNHVIEHIPDDYSIFQTAHSLLKDDGQFLLGCPTEGCFWWMLAYALYPKSIRESDHIHFYNASTLIKMGEQSGFRCVSKYQLGYGFPEWRVDSILRRYKFFDDMFDIFGRVFFKNQSSAIYLVFEKN